MNTHIAMQTHTTAESEEPIDNVAHVTGDLDTGIVNLDFNTPLSYATLTTDRARELAAAVNYIANGLDEARGA